MLTANKCKTCGEKLGNPGDNYIHIEFIAKGNCFSCYHWSSVFSKKDSVSLHVITNMGTHYFVDSEKPISKLPNHLLGHSGKYFKITFKEGTEIIANNLWCQGVMPPFWRKKHPDNAELSMLTDTEKAKLLQ